MKLLPFSLLFCVCFGGANLKAQSPGQVIIANGGVFGPSNMVTIAAWNLQSGSYTVFDSFPGSSVQHVYIKDRSAYVAADSLLVKYDLDSLQRKAITTVYGIRQISSYADKVLVTTGFGASGDRFIAFNSSDLSPAFSISGIVGNCEGIAVWGDTAYIAVPISFTSTYGKLAIVDLNNQILKREVDLDTMGRQIGNVYYDGGRIFTVNRIRFTSTHGYISAYNISNGSLMHHKVDLHTTMGAGILNGKLYATFGNGLGGFSLAQRILVDTNVVVGDWAASAIDQVNQRFYVTRTDYSSYGRMLRFDLSGNVIDSIEVGISPEAFALDYDLYVGRDEETKPEIAMSLYPQPFSDELNVVLKGKTASVSEVSFHDLAGRQVSVMTLQGGSPYRLSTRELAPGIYFLRMKAGKETLTAKVIKIQP